MDMQRFMADMKAKCEVKANQLAKLEMSVWDKSHEESLIKDFGYTDKTVASRKRTLTKKAAQAVGDYSRAN